jgi:hypothetical protein
MPATAQRKKAPSKPAVAPREEVAKRRPTPRRIIRLKGDIIEGKVQKPEAFYVLQRTGMSFEALELETKLIPKILEGLRKPPF